jgi:hemerythrin-like domain-containing protein
MKEDNTMTDTSPLVGGLLRIHKIITRGLTISIRKCDEYIGKNSTPSGEATGFTMYVSALRRVIHSHHLSEDEIVFPYFKDRIEAPYDRLMNDHNVIAGLLAKMEECLAGISSDRVAKLREVLDELYNLWKPHIKIEEENFTSEKVWTVVGIKEQESLSEKLGEHGRKNSGPGPLTLPFLFYNLENKERDAFMSDIPWIVKKILVPIVWRKQWKPMDPFFL